MVVYRGHDERIVPRRHQDTIFCAVPVGGIGEAVERLSQEFRAQHPDVPWQLIAGMRDHVIHGYDVVDWDEVWKTATKDAPDLLAKIEPLLPKKSG
ncbi:MAG: HepT-like ribonuclease domain-containing protein [Chloroflexota bacterium]